MSLTKDPFSIVLIMLKKHVCFILSYICIAGIHAQTPQQSLDSLTVRANRMGLFNGNVLVIDQGKEVYRKAIGYADASKSTMLTDNYRFHIGSIAKEFNAVAIMMLKEQGKLSLDDKVAKFITDLPEWSKTVSLRHLLQYTSGLPDLKWKTINGNAAAMDSLKKVQQLDFEPGTKYAYNNSNTLLQRSIVEKIAGMSFSEFVYSKLLKPLNMSSAIIDPGENIPLVAKSFNDSFVQAPMTSPISGWTALTLDDFYKWEQGLETFRLISPSSTLEILTPFAPRKQCGLGGGSMESNKLTTHIHDGTSLFYQALITSNTPSGRTVILLTNNKQNNLYDINGAIQNILDGKPYRQPKKSVMAALQDKLDTATGAELLAAYRQLKMRHAGEYHFDDQSVLNSVGYVLLNKKRVDAAISIFEYNTSLFPDSGNVFDSLGEAYYIKGDKKKSLLNYKKAFQLDPANEAAKLKIDEMEH